jgi:hypothetical protein
MRGAVSRAERGRGRPVRNKFYCEINAVERFVMPLDRADAMHK